MQKPPSLSYRNNRYLTSPRRVPLIKKLFPSIVFYKDVLCIVLWASRRAKKGGYSDSDWCRSSLDTIRSLEAVGAVFHISGIEHLRKIDTPCVFIGNHMSTLETFALPAIIRPFMPVTFVVKEGLVEYPVFRHIMLSRDPVVVRRTNPREDLKVVLEGGEERLKRGVSIVIFPQQPRGGARSVVFDPTAFNTMGIKLAKRAGVPVVPFAVKTDAWGNGKWLKDFGKIDPTKNVHIAFGGPLRIKDRGVEEHQAVIDFIMERLLEWGGKCITGRAAS